MYTLGSILCKNVCQCSFSLDANSYPYPYVPSVNLALKPFNKITINVVHVFVDL